LISSPGPMGALLLTICAIAAIVSGSEGGPIISGLLFFWLIGWAISKGSN
jgi:hypothetical protein